MPRRRAAPAVPASAAAAVAPSRSGESGESAGSEIAATDPALLLARRRDRGEEHDWIRAFLDSAVWGTLAVPSGPGPPYVNTNLFVRRGGPERLYRTRRPLTVTSTPLDRTATGSSFAVAPLGIQRTASRSASRNGPAMPATRSPNTFQLLTTPTIRRSGITTSSWPPKPRPLHTSVPRWLWTHQW